MMCRVLLLLLVVLVARASLATTQSGDARQLRFRADTRTFKIVQFTDQHYGEGEDVAWGRQQDINSTRVMRSVLHHETPDLVVYTGDQLTGNNIHDNATSYWRELLAPTLAANLSWAFVFGNHDDMPLQPGHPQHGLGSDTSRAQLLAFDNQFPGSLSFDENPALPGVTNFHLNIKHSTGNGSTPLFFFDSGGGTLPEVVHEAQVDWYRSLPSTSPGIAFMHIPLQQYTTAIASGEGCFGMHHDDVTPQARDTGLFRAFVDKSDVQAVFVGHNHGNDWCCSLSGLWLCYGRHT
ncbi:hypothetical protein PTSG_12018 [Salpingoeca rosetta]|uniref:Calcineurin-like phosphoesterase domain-containing protein n=1 Tax=Salpingoeca rosetta (strain ATCC 50818 / BSB-021) TaxID=946362 RepID=F2U527_SALR5|nr:uncharacterized protein PTSG_12018 [Salpingoeca rosetta]EGD82743.1 hypothetical protein PTSG_12018 [Salpingoeca rosetta]|eukprot:XP_004995979.1 hypothetical protein PTSG_12018 [Salpingoeca rosetta]